METLNRSVHNTNSRNFVKLDYTDLQHCLRWSSELGEMSEDELVTVERLKIVATFMKRKYEQDKIDRAS